MTELTRHCAAGLHGFCQEDRQGCACPDCHLGPCTRCGADNLMTLYDGRCAKCVRETAAVTPPAPTRCDGCGASGAFRNPGTRRNELLCVDCHKAAGEPLSLVGSVAGLVADCAGADVTDPRHEWAHIRGTRFGCVRCKTLKFDQPLRALMRREALHG